MLNIFQVDLENYIKVKFAFMYHLHIAGSEVEHWPYWEYEMMIETLNDVLQKKQQAEKKAYKDTDAYKGSDPSRAAGSLLKQASSSMPKAPSMPSPGSFKMPRM